MCDMTDWTGITYDARSGVYDLIILDMLDDRIISAEEFPRYRFNGSLIGETKI